MIRWIIFIAVLVLIEFYSYQAFRTLFKSKWVAIGSVIVSVLVFTFIVYQFATFDRSHGQNKTTLITAAILLLMLLPKLLIVVVLLSEDLYRAAATLVSYFSKSDTFLGHVPNRREFVSKIALGLAAVPFLSLLYGIFVGRYDFRVIRQTLFFDDLPDAFDGYRITQISDIHSGSFDNPEKIDYAISLINEQQSDVILFTGDIVNTHAHEMDPWIDAFNKIDVAPDGKFSVLGNHDYGEYVTWNSNREKRENFDAIKDIHRKIDFRLLLNEHAVIRRGDESISIVGVENWGHNFKKAGDLGKASDGIADSDFKILLSHDPSHWEHEVKDHPKNFHLTLSGHTHGFQFGIEIPGFFKWSPVQYVYKQWAGLYENMGRYIYVNRGLGYHAYPGRVGIWPEITVIELKKRPNAA